MLGFLTELKAAQSEECYERGLALAATAMAEAQVVPGGPTSAVSARNQALYYRLIEKVADSCCKVTDGDGQAPGDGPVPGAISIWSVKRQCRQWERRGCAFA